MSTEEARDKSRSSNLPSTKNLIPTTVKAISKEDDDDDDVDDDDEEEEEEEEKEKEKKEKEAEKPHDGSNWFSDVNSGGPLIEPFDVSQFAETSRKYTGIGCFLRFYLT